MPAKEKIKSGNVLSHSYILGQTERDQLIGCGTASPSSDSLISYNRCPQITGFYTGIVYSKHILTTTFIMNLIRESDVKASESSIVRRKGLANPVRTTVYDTNLC